MVSSQSAQYADMFAALGSEPRLEIMRLLFAVYPEGMTVGEIQAELQIPNSTLSHHLEKLRNEDLVNCRKQRQFFYYSANAAAMENLLSFLSTKKAFSTTNSTVNKTPVEDGFMQDNFFQFFQSVFTNLLGSLSNRLHLQGYDRFNDKAIQAMHLAQLEARRLKHEFIGTEQILLGVLRDKNSQTLQLLNQAGVNLENAQIQVEKIIGKGKQTTLVDIPFTPRVKRVLELAVEASNQTNNSQIGTEHLLLGILNEGGGVAIRVLQNLQVDLSGLETNLRNAIA